MRPINDILSYLILKQGDRQREREREREKGEIENNYMCLGSNNGVLKDSV